MAEVVLEDVTKTFNDGEVVAVENADLEVRDKEFLVLVGPSGCGKSTTLRMIAGLEDITEGIIEIGEDVVNDVPPKDRDIAMVFQNYALYPHMNVYDNMAFGLKLRKFPKDEIDRRVNEAADILGIPNLLDRKPKQLSGGQRQRVALGRAIVREPKVFLMDEPLSNLDAKLRVQMRAELSKLHDRLQTTVIYVTHDQTEAMTMGDRIVVLRDGKIQQVAPPMELYRKPVNMFVGGFIGSPAMNFTDASLAEKNGDIYVQADDEFEIKLAEELVEANPQVSDYVDKDVVFGIRPEDLNDAEITQDVDVATENTLDAEVEVVEPMGSEINLYINTGSREFIATVDADSKADVGDTVTMAVTQENMHIFDKETEESVFYS
ncbi:ABC transporter ATP-binding protein [Halarsenatibacter silvermanii]|uniref:Carbohydrate ABC transporter ATP-binding protein, CUT1 family n=1 Tax=Halarsenatibacter silvermanii TaxID=321763 RepID=A0A1G9QBR9_9FIRM|nr:sn-glycerol-3-phosphate ABC transporter ATP-binding protein UgpC [Halarsenatibacter silvermanii]SDM08478.1 carbohydrate ABC transporter ATP-binding protein, CUT1 family [Halarsenatibacter silvermanii]